MPASKTTGGEAQMLCPCGSQLRYTACCEVFITGKSTGKKPAPTPEALMRSRYSAYVQQAYDYILASYAAPERLKLSSLELAKHDEATQWLRLDVQKAQGSEVEFKAYYRSLGQYYVMHEISHFVQEDGEWCYSSGKIQQGSGKLDIGRNSVCVCGSGKKFKRCCG
jgi:SEC-C motif-containing protein